MMGEWMDDESGGGEWFFYKLNFLNTVYYFVVVTK